VDGDFERAVLVQRRVEREGPREALPGRERPGLVQRRLDLVDVDVEVDVRAGVVDGEVRAVSGLVGRVHRRGRHGTRLVFRRDVVRDVGRVQLFVGPGVVDRHAEGGVLLQWRVEREVPGEGLPGDEVVRLVQRRLVVVNVDVEVGARRGVIDGEVRAVARLIHDGEIRRHRFGFLRGRDVVRDVRHVQFLVRLGAVDRDAKRTVLFQRRGEREVSVEALASLERLGFVQRRLVLVDVEVELGTRGRLVDREIRPVSGLVRDAQRGGDVVFRHVVLRRLLVFLGHGERELVEPVHRDVLSGLRFGGDGVPPGREVLDLFGGFAGDGHRLLGVVTRQRGDDRLVVAVRQQKDVAAEVGSQRLDFVRVLDDERPGVVAVDAGCVAVFSFGGDGVLARRQAGDLRARSGGDIDGSDVAGVVLDGHGDADFAGVAERDVAVVDRSLDVGRARLDGDVPALLAAERNGRPVVGLGGERLLARRDVERLLTAGGHYHGRLAGFVLDRHVHREDVGVRDRHFLAVGRDAEAPDRRRVVRVERVSSLPNLRAVGETVAVGVRVVRVRPEFLLSLVDEAVVVAVARFGVVGVERVRTLLDFLAVRDAVIVGVGVRRVGVQFEFAAVLQPVVVRVGVVRVRVERFLLVGVAQAVTVAVGAGEVARVGRVSSLPDLRTVGGAVAVRVGVLRVGVHVGFPPVDEAVVVRVDVQRVGPVHVDLRAVGESVAVGVGVTRVRAEFVLSLVGESVAVAVAHLGVVGVERVRTLVDLFAVRDTVTVGVGVRRVGSDVDLSTVLQSVAVRVAVRRIGAVGEHLRAVAQPVAVGVGPLRIGADPAFLLVRQSVAVGVVLSDNAVATLAAGVDVDHGRRPVASLRRGGSGGGCALPDDDLDLRDLDDLYLGYFLERARTGAFRGRLDLHHVRLLALRDGAR